MAVAANDALQAVLILGGVVIAVLAWQALPSWDPVVGEHSLDDGRRGALFAGLLKLPNLFLLILPGVLATVLYPDLDNPGLVFPMFAFDLLPVGLRGFMLAVLAAAVLSSLEAILHSGSTLFTMDFV